MGDPSIRRRLGRNRFDHLVLVLDVLQPRHVLRDSDRRCPNSPSRTRMAIERSCAVTAVALSGQRRAGAAPGDRPAPRLRRELADFDIVHVPYPVPRRDWTRRTLTCGVALQCSPSKERIADYRLHELSGRELSALTLSRPASRWGGSRRTGPDCSPRCARLLPDLEPAPADMDAQEMLNRAIALSRTATTASRRSAARQACRSAYTTPQGLSDKLRRSFGRLPWTTTQKRTPATAFGTRGRRRWRPQSQPAPTEPTAGQRPRHHAGSPPGDPVSGVERVDEELHARPRRGSRATRTAADTGQPGAGLRRPHASGSRSTPTAR